MRNHQGATSMLLHVLEIEEKLKSQKFLSLSEAKEQIDPKSSGFYWIYSDLSMEKLKAAKTPVNQAHIDIAEIVKVHESLKHVIKSSKLDRWCIYNGKGKQLKNRIVAEFTNTKSRTGKLALLRAFKEDDFRVKYVVCSSNATFGVAASYENLEKHLERAWRLNFGWPVLCRA